MKPRAGAEYPQNEEGHHRTNLVGKPHRPGLLLHHVSRTGGFLMKLYRSQNYRNRWYAYSDSTGWVVFPAEIKGWDKRKPARGIDPIDIREVPLQLALDTGIPGLPKPMTDRTETANGNFSEAA
jgi:hypothetical protein